MLKPKPEVMKTLGRVYKDVITLQRPTKTPDGQGGNTTGWATAATVNAYFRNPKVTTDTQTGAVVSQTTKEIAIQNRPGVPNIKKGWQVLFGQKKFLVEHIYDDDYNRERIIVYKESTP